MTITTIVIEGTNGMAVHEATSRTARIHAGCNLHGLIIEIPTWIPLGQTWFRGKVIVKEWKG